MPVCVPTAQERITQQYVRPDAKTLDEQASKQATYAPHRVPVFFFFSLSSKMLLLTNHRQRSNAHFSEAQIMTGSQIQETNQRYKKRIHQHLQKNETKLTGYNGFPATIVPKNIKHRPSSTKPICNADGRVWPPSRCRQQKKKTATRYFAYVAFFLQPKYHTCRKASTNLPTKKQSPMHAQASKCTHPKKSNHRKQKKVNKNFSTINQTKNKSEKKKKKSIYPPSLSPPPPSL